MELCIKENELSLSGRFDIYDMNGNSVYYVTRKIALKHELSLYDMNDRCIAEIKQCSFHSLSSFLIVLSGQEYHLIQKFHLLRTHVFLKEKEWELKGDITSHNYEIYSPLETVATIQQKWVSFGNCYYLNCQNSADSLLSLCTMLAVDMIEKLRQK